MDWNGENTLEIGRPVKRVLTVGHGRGKKELKLGNSSSFEDDVRRK